MPTGSTKHIRETCGECGCFLIQCRCGMCAEDRELGKRPSKKYQYRCKSCWDEAKAYGTICLTRPEE